MVVWYKETRRGLSDR